MPKGGLEPPRVAPYAPQTYVSTSSTTSARSELLLNQAVTSRRSPRYLPSASRPSSNLLASPAYFFFAGDLSAAAGVAPVAGFPAAGVADAAGEASGVGNAVG